MHTIKKINFFIEEKLLSDTVETIYNLVRSKHYLLRDPRKVFATKLRNFIDIMKTWGWNVSTDTQGNVVGIEYFGDAPMSYQKILFENIASNVKPGCFINFETDEIKNSWQFDGEKLLMK